MLTKIDRKAKRNVRHERLRKKVQGSAACPRLAVYRSNKHIYAQLIDDEAGKTLVSVCTLEADVKGEVSGEKKVDQAKKIGALIGKKAAESGISSAVFDRGGNKFHGRVKALCDAAREAGLKI